MAAEVRYAMVLLPDTSKEAITSCIEDIEAAYKASRPVDFEWEHIDPAFRKRAPDEIARIVEAGTRKGASDAEREALDRLERPDSLPVTPAELGHHAASQSGREPRYWLQFNACLRRRGESWDGDIALTQIPHLVLRSIGMPVCAHFVPRSKHKWWDIGMRTGVLDAAWESGVVVGMPSKLYLINKMHSVDSVRQLLVHCVSDGGASRILELQDVVSGILDKKADAPIELKLTQDMGSMREFCKKCDELLLRELGPDQLERMLEGLGVTAHEWLSASEVIQTRRPDMGETRLT